METILENPNILLACIPDPALILDPQGITVYGNPAFSKLTGILEEELAGIPLDTLKIEEKYKNLFWENYASMKAGDVIRRKFLQRQKDGEFRHFDIRLMAVECPVKADHVVCYLIIGNDITDIVDKSQQIVFMEAELQNAVDTLRQLLYKSSHDLRGPIATINGLIGLARLTKSTEEINEYLNLIQQSSEKMDAILSDLRVVYTMYLGNFVSEKIDFHDLLDKVLKRHQESDTEVTTEVQLTRDHFHCRYLTEKILDNLLNNAFKYKKNGNRFKHCIGITITDNDDALYIKIEDNGIGIKEHIQDDIFGMFFKGEYGSKKNGMGLFIVKTAVDKMHGRIHVESKAGQGTAFTVILP